MEKRRIPIQSTSVASYLSRVCLLFSRLISPPCFAEKGELRRFPLKVAQLGAIANSGRSKLLAQKLSALTALREVKSQKSKVKSTKKVQAPKFIYGK